MGRTDITIRNSEEYGETITHILETLEKYNIIEALGILKGVETELILNIVEGEFFREDE